MINPFFNRGPIRDPRFYFTRPAETREVMRLVAGSKNCSLRGPVKSGKTSLLLHLSRPGALGKPEGTCAVYLSFEGLGKLSAEQFFHLMVEETIRQARASVTVVWPRLGMHGALEFLDLKAVLDQIEGRGRQLVYLLDELELAALNPAFDLNFFSALRHIASRPGVCFVAATDRPLHELEIAGREIGSPFADVFSVVRLRPLADDVAWTRIADLAAESGVDLAPERDLVLEVGGGWPYYLQVAAYEVFEHRSRTGPLSEEDRVYLRSRVYEQLEPVLWMLWERLREPERKSALAALDGGGCEVDGLTTTEGGRLRPVNATVRRFLREREREERMPTEAQVAAEPAAPTASMIHGVVRALVRAVEARDRYVRGHCDQVARLAAAIAKEMGCPRDVQASIRMAARLHDIGRVSVSDMILLKPGPLTELETEIIRTHPLVGAQILDALEFPWSVRPAVRYHHERLDGSGYPEGLMEDEIPFGARVLAVADVMAAMTADRPHRRARSQEEALAELAQNAGVKYDEQVVKALMNIVERESA